MSDELSFPRHSARTRRFTLGAPRAFTVAPDGSRVLFLRSRGGADPVTCLWSLDVDTGAETLLADPVALLGDAAEDLPPEERARRERARESAAGIVVYATDERAETVSFTLSGQAYVVRAGERPRALPARSPVVDPRVDPTGCRVAYVHAGALRVVGRTGEDDRALAEPDGDVTFGLAEFVAAEEMDRTRGYWWAPDGERLLVARVDEARVPRWHIGDPEHPERQPVEHAYPAAGTVNADVRLFVVDLAGERVEVRWDRTAFEYVATAQWTPRALLVVVQSRDQRTVRLLRVDPSTGATSVEHEDVEPEWVELVRGVPAWCGDRLVWAADVDGWRRLLLDGEVATPPGLQVRRVLGADDDGVLFAGSTEPTEVHVYRVVPGKDPEQVSSGEGVHDAVAAGGTTVLVSASLDAHGTRATVRRDGAEPRTIASYAEAPALVPAVELLRVGDRELRTAVLFPSGHEPGSRRLPVLVDPYGGPHAQRVMRRRGLFYEPQWFADQGFAVVVADGRGSPGRGAAWERAVYRDLATGVLADQVEALQGAAAAYPDLDLGKVAIRGWSFGGFLSALAVLRQPDVFHAGIAGAPVTDQRLYDTHYTERYLGHPDREPEAYRRSSVIEDAPRLTRPLMIVHGLVDDNVVAAHTLRLSSALLAAGRPHTVLPLSGVTHMASQEVVAENLLLLQVQFLKDALAT